MAEGDPIQLTGKVIAVLPGTMFRIELPNGHQILGHICGKIRRNFVRLDIGDRVRLEMVPYDLQKGRITARMRDPNEVRAPMAARPPMGGSRGGHHRR